jgi:hypothetical protein
MNVNRNKKEREQSTTQRQLQKAKDTECQEIRLTSYFSVIEYENFLESTKLQEYTQRLHRNDLDLENEYMDDDGGVAILA